MNTSIPTVDPDRTARYVWSEEDAPEVIDSGDGEDLAEALYGESQNTSAVTDAEPETYKGNIGSIEGMARYHGLPVVIETPAGTVRRGLFWKVHMPADYGYIAGVEGADGDELDCYVGSNPESDVVVVIDQNKMNGRDFDEHKVMLGFDTADSALEAYMLGHHKASKVYRGKTILTMRDFIGLLDEGDFTRPLGE